MKKFKYKKLLALSLTFIMIFATTMTVIANNNPPWFLTNSNRNTEMNSILTSTETRIVIINNKHPFTDVNTNNWYANAVQFVWENNVMNGISDTTFAPNDNFTRSQAVTLLFRLYHGRLADDTDPRDSRFEDVDESNWFAPYVVWADDNNIVNGISATQFAPDRDISRQELAVILFNYADFTGMNRQVSNPNVLHRFTDRGDISSWAYEGVRWANYNLIMNGISNSRIDPLGTTTRAQAAQLMMNLVDPIRIDTRVPVIVANNGWAQGRVFFDIQEWNDFRWSEENMNNSDPTTGNVPACLINGVLSNVGSGC